MEGKIKIKFDDDDTDCLDFISILLVNGYTLTLNVENDELEILYFKEDK